MICTQNDSCLVDFVVWRTMTAPNGIDEPSDWQNTRVLPRVYSHEGGFINFRNQSDHRMTSLIIVSNHYRSCLLIRGTEHSTNTLSKCINSYFSTGLRTHENIGGSLPAIPIARTTSAAFHAENRKMPKGPQRSFRLRTLDGRASYRGAKVSFIRNRADLWTRFSYVKEYRAPVPVPVHPLKKIKVYLLAISPLQVCPANSKEIHVKYQAALNVR